jgi:hypothetical protein
MYAANSSVLYSCNYRNSGPLLGASKERAMLTKQRGISEKRGRIFAQLKSSIYHENSPAVSAVKAEMGSVRLRADNEEQ